MTRNVITRRAASALAITIAARPPGATWAAGYEILEQSAVTQGNAYAGAGARADDPSTMYYNPAGITHLSGFQISGGLSAIFPQGTLASGTATPGLPAAFAAFNTPYRGVTGTNSGVNVAVPNFYATGQVADTLFLGLALTSPFGLATKYPSNSIARYYAQTSQLRTINIGPTVAWRPIPQLSVGAGLNVETSDAHLSQNIDFGTAGFAHGLGALGFLPGTNTGSATIKGSDTAIGWNIGLLYEPVPGTRIGLTYRSAIFHDLSGTATFYNVPPIPAFQAQFANTSVKAKIPDPSTTSLSVAQDFGPWTFLGSLTYTGWSVFHNLNATAGPASVSFTPEHFRDTLAISLGVDYRVNDKLTLRAGTMYDPTPVQNQYRTAQLPDSDRYWLSIGATYRPIPNLALSAAYSHIFAAASTVNLASAGPPGTLTATYNLSIDIFSMQATYKF